MAADVLPSSREGLLRLLYEEDRVVAEDRIVVAAAMGEEMTAAGDLGSEKRERLAEMWRMLRDLERPFFPLRGRDILGEGGIEAGVQMGKLLGEVEAWWVSRNFVDDRAGCLAEARRLLRERSAGA